VCRWNGGPGPSPPRRARLFTVVLSDFFAQLAKTGHESRLVMVRAFGLGMELVVAMGIDDRHEDEDDQEEDPDAATASN